MEWMEADPLPAECRDCREEDCYNCDTALKRWYLSQEDELRMQHMGLHRAVARLRQLEKKMSGEEKAKGGQGQP